MSITVGPGMISQLSVVDMLPYGSLPADTTDPLLKIGININPTTFALTAPTTSGQSVNFLIQAAFQESDINPVVLPYYNAAQPSQPLVGRQIPLYQNTLRTQCVELEMKPGTPATSGTQTTPPVDSGWTGLYIITVLYGQTSITTASISILPTAPFLPWKLPWLRPGFGSGTQSFLRLGISMFPRALHR